MRWKWRVSFAWKLTIKDKYADQRRDFDNQRELARVNAGGTLAADIAKFYQDKIDLSRVYEDQALKSYTQGVAGRLAAEGEWVIGAGRAFKNYSDTAANVAQQTEALFSNAFRGLEDSLVSFVSTGKLDFKSLADSIIADLIRIQARAAISNMFGGGSGGGLLGSVVSGVGSLFGGGAASAATGSYTGASFGTLALNATGGVYDSPSLSAYRNQIHDTPKLFAFAKGAGVLGEAGPEAIMPLTRAADGNLGVRALGAAGGGSKVIVNIQNNAGVQIEQSSRMGDGGEQIIDVILERAETSFAGQIAGGYGRFDQALRSRKNQGM